jgi:hypothetical protein
LGIINQAGTEDYLPELTEDCALPVLQDTAEDGVFGLYGAEKWYVYVIDRAGSLRYLHYSLDLPSEDSRLIEEIAVLVAEEAP